MNYAEALKKSMDSAEPATGMSRERLEAELSTINNLLTGPMSNAERIGLCADRASIRKALEALK